MGFIVGRVESVEKGDRSGVILVILAVEKPGVFPCGKLWEKRWFRTADVSVDGDSEYNLYALPRFLDTVCTARAQVLHMQALLDLIYGSTKIGVNV
jgi:hypothetical protein